METNLIMVNEIFLQCKTSDALPDSTQIAILLNIAYQYPPSDGVAVYIARAILGLHIEDTPPPLRKRKTEKIKSSVIQGTLYPNPTTGNFIYRMTYPLNTFENITIELRDNLSKLVLNIKTKSNYLIYVNAENLNQGFYYFRILLNNNEIDNGKVSIIK